MNFIKLVAAVALAWAGGAACAAESGFTDRYAQVNGVRLHYQVGGKGSPVVLLHGFAQTGHVWGPAMAELVKHHTVIVPDLRGNGKSEKAEGGYDKKNMAVDIHELVKTISTAPAAVVGHDIGMMVAYGYAAQFPADTSRAVFMDAFVPGIGDWRTAFPAKDTWHFHFHGATALGLLQGRERIYLEHFWNHFAADKTRSVSEADRKIYTAAYAQPGAMRSGLAYYVNFERDAADFSEMSKTKLRMPVLTLAGEFSEADFLGKHIGLAATDVKSVIIKGAGHWLIDEAPEQVVSALAHFLN